MLKTLQTTRRFPRLGVIRLGIKVLKAGGKEDKPNDWIPKEVPYFVLPPDLAEQFPENPTSIEVSFPANDPLAVFDPFYTRYDGPTLAIRCDGETCLSIARDGTEATSACKKQEHKPCECKAKALGRLNVIVKKSKVFGVHQVLIGGEGRARSLMGELELNARVVGGLSRAWFTLERVKATEQVQKDDGSRMAKTGYPVHLRLNYSPALLLGDMTPRALEAHPAAPETIPPAIDETEDLAPVGSQAEDLWTLFMDASGQDPKKALFLARATARKHLKREIENLEDLTVEEIRGLIKILSAE